MVPSPGSEMASAKLSFSLLCGLRPVALFLQLGVLIGRQDSFRLLQKRLLAFFGAAGLHAFRLPSFELGLLISVQVERREIGARSFVAV